MKKHEINLIEEQRDFLIKLTSKGKASARKIKRAQILLLADEGKKDKEISEIVRVSSGTVERTRKRFVLEGLESSLEEKPRTGAPKKIDGRAEALIIATACSKAPEGRSEWTVRLLADRMVELDISKSTVHRTLKKMKSNRG